MKIDDKRIDTSWVPAVSILKEFIPKFNKKYFSGIDKIILVDEDYHVSDCFGKAYGRYIRLKGAKSAHIELYFDRFNNLPEDVKESRIYLSYYILRTLLHELYHHKLCHKKIRKPKFEKEQKRADKWAESVLDPIFSESFPKKKYDGELDEIHRKVKMHEWNEFQEIKKGLGIDDAFIEEQKKKMPDLPKSIDDLSIKKIKKMLKKYKK